MFSREQMENAHDSVRRLRSTYKALANISALHTGEDFAINAANEITLAFFARACVIQRGAKNASLAQWETLAVGGNETANSKEIERVATYMAGEVAQLKRPVICHNLLARCPQNSWLIESNINSYIGVPLLNEGQEIVCGVAAVFAQNKQFKEEDEWWMNTAARIVGGHLAYKELENELHSLVHSESVEFAEEIGEVDDHKLSILLIDDDRILNETLAEFLTLEGYRVESAYDGIEAVRNFRPAEHDMVMTDVAMPGMNGWELAAALRVRAPQLPIVLITGYGSGNWNEGYLKKQGIAAVLGKPLDLNQLPIMLDGIAAQIKR